MFYLLASLSGYFALMKILRTRVYVTELKVVTAEYDYDAFDSQSRHVLGLSELEMVSSARLLYR